MGSLHISSLQWIMMGFRCVIHGETDLRHPPLQMVSKKKQGFFEAEPKPVLPPEMHWDRLDASSTFLIWRKLASVLEDGFLGWRRHQIATSEGNKHFRRLFRLLTCDDCNDIICYIILYSYIKIICSLHYAFIHFLWVRHIFERLDSLDSKHPQST